MRPQVGQVINNKYRLLRLIGDGGMGTVYEARHEVLGTSVALKFLHAELNKRQGLVQRFLQEARVSAQIQSPHVVRVADVDQTDTGAFIVMEYIEGKTLQALYEDLYKAGQQLSYGDALEYAMQMLEGVEAAHRTGIVHRDLKPDNVMITVDAKGRALIKLLDFGIAKLKVSGEYERGLTRPGVIMGTPEYMAPEQAISADAVDARADIFSLGVIIFEMLGGRRPVGGEEPHQIASAYLSGQIARLTDLAPELAPELADVVHHAMAALAQDRWPSVAAFRDAMEPFAVAARAPSVTPSAGLSRVSFTSGGQATPNTPSAGVRVVEGSFPAGQRAVPKTLPPEDDGAAHSPVPVSAPVAHRESTSPADPPVMSTPPGRGPTPLGGFAPYGEEAASHAGAEAAGPPFIPPTRSVAPLASVRGNPAATAIASPYVGSPVPSPDAGVQRFSGTAISDGPLQSPYQGGPTGAASGFAGVAPPPVVPSVARGAAPPRRPGPLSSLPAILLLAAGVSAAVVGGVYLAHSRAKTDDHEDPPVAAIPSTTVAADPPPTDEPPQVAVPTPTAGHPSRPTVPTGPFKPPAPKGSAGPVAPAPSSTAPAGPRPPIIPSVLPPVIIPTSLPFDFPLLPPPRPQADPQQPPRERPPRGGDQPPPRGERPQREPWSGPPRSPAEEPPNVPQSGPT